MNPKICAAPAGGGSAGGAVRYANGYTLSRKEKQGLRDGGFTPEQIKQEETDRANAFDDLMCESLERDDLGVGVMWEPACGAKTGRPAPVLAQNVNSFATADQEMDAWAEVAKRAGVKEHTIHTVWSFSPEETRTLTKQQMMDAAQEGIKEFGLENHASVFALHLDTDHGHVHVMTSAMDPDTLLAFERNRDRLRISRAARQVEINQGLRHDHGAYVVEHENDGTKTIRLATAEEKKTWKIDNLEENMDRQITKAKGDYEGFEDVKSWGEEIEMKITDTNEKMLVDGLETNWADAHQIAASYGGRLVKDDDGELYVQVRERLTEEQREELRLEHYRDTIDDEGEKYMGAEWEPPTTRATGERVRIRSKELKASNAFEDAPTAEKHFEAMVRDNPSYVSRVITNVEGKGTFDRNDVDRYIASRVSDTERAANLGDHVVQNDKEIEMRAVDTPHPVYVRKDLEAQEQHVADKVTKLANQRDLTFNRHAFERSLFTFEKKKRAEQAAAGEPATFALTKEQRDLCEASAQNRLAWCNGDPGTGKTTSMEVLKEYAKETNRPIIGLSTSQAAANKLQGETGIKTFNFHKAQLAEARGKQVIPDNAIVICDETSMTSYRSMDKLTELAEKRNLSITGIGDSAQIKNIEAGSPHEVIKNITKDSSSYVELKEVRRQKGELEWMRPEVSKAGEAIRTGDAQGVEHFVNTLDRKGHFVPLESREHSVNAAADWYMQKPDATSLVTTKDKLAAKHGNDVIRERLGLKGQGQKFRMKSGTREFAVSDRIQFQENRNLHLSKEAQHMIPVANNDFATIMKMKQDKHTGEWWIHAKLDKNGQTVMFSPDRYKKVEHGYFSTATKSQGQSVHRTAAILDKSADANTAFVQMTRSTNELKVFYSTTNFKDAAELGKHLGGRIQQDKDVMLIDRAIARTGGPETAWAKNMRAAQASASHPDRKLYVWQQRLRHGNLENRRLTITKKYASKIRATSDAAEKSKLRQLLGREAASINREQSKVAKETFGSWAVKRKGEQDAGGRSWGRVLKYREQRAGQSVVPAAAAKKKGDLSTQMFRGHDRIFRVHVRQKAG